MSVDGLPIGRRPEHGSGARDGLDALSASGSEPVDRVRAMRAAQWVSPFGRQPLAAIEQQLQQCVALLSRRGLRFERVGSQRGQGLRLVGALSPGWAELGAVLDAAGLSLSFSPEVMARAGGADVDFNERIFHGSARLLIDGRPSADDLRVLELVHLESDLRYGIGSFWSGAAERRRSAWPRFQPLMRMADPYLQLKQVRAAVRSLLEGREVRGGLTPTAATAAIISRLERTRAALERLRRLCESGLAQLEVTPPKISISSEPSGRARLQRARAEVWVDADGEETVRLELPLLWVGAPDPNRAQQMLRSRLHALAAISHRQGKVADLLQVELTRMAAGRPTASLDSTLSKLDRLLQRSGELGPMEASGWDFTELGLNWSTTPGQYGLYQIARTLNRRWRTAPELSPDQERAELKELGDLVEAVMTERGVPHEWLEREGERMLRVGAGESQGADNLLIAPELEALGYELLFSPRRLVASKGASTDAVHRSFFGSISLLFTQEMVPPDYALLYHLRLMRAQAQAGEFHWSGEVETLLDYPGALRQGMTVPLHLSAPLSAVVGSVAILEALQRLEKPTHPERDLSLALEMLNRSLVGILKKQAELVALCHQASSRCRQGDIAFSLTSDRESLSPHHLTASVPVEWRGTPALLHLSVDSASAYDQLTSGAKIGPEERAAALAQVRERLDRLDRAMRAIERTTRRVHSELSPLLTVERVALTPDDDALLGRALEQLRHALDSSENAMREPVQRRRRTGDRTGRGRARSAPPDRRKGKVSPAGRPG